MAFSVRRAKPQRDGRHELRISLHQHRDMWKVMTYNIQGHAAARRADHIPKIAETIAAVAPDVVGLQEVHCRTRQSAAAGQRMDLRPRLPEPVRS